MKEPVLNLGEADDGREIEAAAGQELRIQLAENPTSGYRWQVSDSGEPVCALCDHAFEPGSAPGQPGTHRWRFKAERPGASHINLVYRRSWDSGAAARLFRVRVRVK